MGAWGNWLSTNIFTLDARGKAKEQARILDMAKKNKRELYRYNLARDVEPGISWESYKNLAEKYRGLGLRTGEKTGGRVGYTGGGLTRTVAPDSGPMSHGLRSLYIDDKDY